MEYVLLCIGATAKGFLEQGIAEYCKRLHHYTSFGIQALPAIRNAQSLSVSELMSREAASLLDAVRSSDVVVLLDERGKEKSSREFAQFLQGEMNAGRKRIVFIVGGAYGVSDEVRSRASTSLRLSAMTLTHDMVRLLFIEQLYRAHTILAGEKYHHE